MTNAETLPDSWLDLIRTHSTIGQSIDLSLTRVMAAVAVAEWSGKTIFPCAHLRFRAFAENQPSAVRAVIIGQDPYHGMVTKGGRSTPEATGLCFSIPDGAKIAPSLRNIFKEMSADIGCPVPASGDLSHWSASGVLMINALLTVEANTPKSHKKLGWQAITGAAIEALSRQHPGIAFILWGNDAKEFKPLIADNGHLIIESSHPSPIGGSCNKGFFGSRPFSRANDFLVAQGKLAIQWAPAASIPVTPFLL